MCVCVCVLTELKIAVCSILVLNYGQRIMDLIRLRRVVTTVLRRVRLVALSPLTSGTVGVRGVRLAILSTSAQDGSLLLM